MNKNKLVEIKEFYNKAPDGIVWLHRKISDAPWEVIETPFTEVPIEQR